MGSWGSGCGMFIFNLKTSFSIERIKSAIYFLCTCQTPLYSLRGPFSFLRFDLLIYKE